MTHWLIIGIDTRSLTHHPSPTPGRWLLHNTMSVTHHWSSHGSHHHTSHSSHRYNTIPVTHQAMSHDSHHTVSTKIVYIHHQECIHTTIDNIFIVTTSYSSPPTTHTTHPRLTIITIDSPHHVHESEGVWVGGPSDRLGSVPYPNHKDRSKSEGILEYFARVESPMDGWMEILRWADREGKLW